MAWLSAMPFCCLGKSALTLHASEAIAAVDGPVSLGLKGDLGLAATGSTGSGEILSGTTGRIFTGIAAGLAALRLVLEAALGIELLLTGSEHKFCTTFLAN